MAGTRKDKDKEAIKSLTWAVKCRSCLRYSRYNEYYQKPKMHSGRLGGQAAHARCPKCGAENDYRAVDLELIANDELDTLT
jgi:predicted nucleic-acid-binding Zn-ribbon protein